MRQVQGNNGSEAGKQGRREDRSVGKRTTSNERQKIAFFEPPTLLSLSCYNTTTLLVGFVLCRSCLEIKGMLSCSCLLGLHCALTSLQLVGSHIPLPDAVNIFGPDAGPGVLSEIAQDQSD